MARKGRGKKRATHRADPATRSQRAARVASLPVWLPWLGLTLATFGAYWGALGAGWTFDDHFLVVGNRNLESLDVSELRSGWGRQVRTLTLMLDYALYGTDPAGYHLQSVLWHLACVFLSYAVMRKLTFSVALAFTGALIFALHPIHVEAVANIANRKEPLCLAFSLLCLLSYARFFEVADRRRWAWLVASALCAAVAIFAKQVAIVLPASMVAWELLFVPQERRFLTRSLWVPILGAVGAGAAMLGIFDVVGYLGDIETERIGGYRVQGYWGEASVMGFVLTAARAFWTYWELLIWPVGVCPDHVVTLSTTILDPGTLFAWLGLIGFVVLSVASARWSAPLSFGLIWIWIHFLPVSNLIPSAYVLADRYMYIPSFGFCLALVAVAALARDRIEASAFPSKLPIQRGAVVLTAVVTIALASGTIAYVRHWQDNGTMWSYTLHCSPRSYRAHEGLGTHYLLGGEAQRALAEYDQGIVLRPGSATLHYNRGNALYALSRYPEAIADYERAAEAGSRLPELYYNLGMSYYEVERYESALASFNRAIKRRSGYSDAFVNRGRTFTRLGRSDKAVADYERAVELEPRNAAAHYNLGSHYRARGDEQAAIRSYLRAAELGLPQAQEALARMAE